MKKSKQAYYDKYFEKNWNNIKNTWKEIKSLISLKTVASNILTVLSLDNVDTVTNPYDIANTFNNYFASIAETTKKKKNIHINIFPIIFQMKIVALYFCNFIFFNWYSLHARLNNHYEAWSYKKRKHKKVKAYKKPI